MRTHIHAVQYRIQHRILYQYECACTRTALCIYRSITESENKERKKKKKIAQHSILDYFIVDVVSACMCARMPCTALQQVGCDFAIPTSRFQAFASRIPRKSTDKICMLLVVVIYDLVALAKIIYNDAAIIRASR